MAEGSMPKESEVKEGPCLKVKRARHHVNDLRNKIKSFLSAEPFKLVVQIRRNPGAMVLCIRETVPIPREFSLIIGDAIHNLRSALDLTVFQLVGHKAPNPRKVQFPFCDNPEELDRAIRIRHIALSGQKVIDVVRRLRPYPNGNKLLSGVHKLDIEDKHKLLIPAYKAATYWSGDDFADYLDKVFFQGMLSQFFAQQGVPDGIRIRFTTSSDHELLAAPIIGANITEMEGVAPVQPEFTISFAREQPFANTPVIDTLNEACTEVERAIGLLIDASLSEDRHS